MSMELFVCSDRQIGSIEEWQAAIDAEGYPLKLSTDTRFEELNGFLPSSLRGELTGFECYHDDAKELSSLSTNNRFSDSVMIGNTYSGSGGLAVTETNCWLRGWPEQRTLRQPQG